VLAVALVAGVLLGVAGCGSEEGAAEPAQAPPVEEPPAGTVVPVGTQIEGIVADPVTHLVAVGVRAPYDLVLVDGRTGEIAHRVTLPERLRHLQLAAAGGPVLVPGEDSGTVVSIGLPDGEVLARVPIGEWAHDATASPNGTIAVADEMGEALVLVRDGQVVHRFSDDLTQPGGVAAAGDLVGVIDVHEQTLSTYHTLERTRAGRVDAGDGPTHLVADRRGRLVVVDTRGDRLLIFATAPTLEQVEEVALAGTPYGVTYDPQRDRLWVTLTERNQLVGFGLGGGEPREVARFPTVRQPNTVAVDPDTGRVFVASRPEGTLQLIDP
jgi:DNA-binding beta-propeller fold protein YncE